MKTAEEILFSYGHESLFDHLTTEQKDSILFAMEEYASQFTPKPKGEDDLIQSTCYCSDTVRSMDRNGNCRNCGREIN